MLFRGVNEAIEEQAAAFGGLDGYEFICECSSTECMDRITLELTEYEHVRSGAAWFFVTPGHQNDEVEFVVTTKPTFLIVEKDGAAGAIAVSEDPRADDEQ